MESITPPRSDQGSKSPAQRYSDDSEAATKSKNRKSDGGKKKGAFSSFVNSMLGSPRRPTISTPSNPMHVTHVSIDNQTGEFTVCDTLFLSAPPLLAPRHDAVHASSPCLHLPTLISYLPVPEPR
jgi:p21-activated kinase 1